MKVASLRIGSAELWLLAWSGSAQPAPLQAIDQGTKWNTAARKDFYSRDQGSNQGSRAQADASSAFLQTAWLRGASPGAFGGDKR
jgi:hypothetical protein